MPGPMESKWRWGVRGEEGNTSTFSSCRPFPYSVGLSPAYCPQPQSTPAREGGMLTSRYSPAHTSLLI